MVLIEQPNLHPDQGILQEPITLVLRDLDQDQEVETVAPGSLEIMTGIHLTENLHVLYKYHEWKINHG